MQSTGRTASPHHNQYPSMHYSNLYSNNVSSVIHSLQCPLSNMTNMITLRQHRPFCNPLAPNTQPSQSPSFPFSEATTTCWYDQALEPCFTQNNNSLIQETRPLQLGHPKPVAVLLPSFGRIQLPLSLFQHHNIGDQSQ
jgi:hypothetical protein